MIAFMDPGRADAASWLGNEPDAPVVAVLVRAVKRRTSPSLHPGARTATSRLLLQIRHF
jgi:hypothetical protein